MKSKSEKRLQKLKKKVIDKTNFNNWEKNLLGSGYVKISKEFTPRALNNRKD